MSMTKERKTEKNKEKLYTKWQQTVRARVNGCKVHSRGRKRAKMNKPDVLADAEGAKLGKTKLRYFWLMEERKEKKNKKIT